MARWPEELRAKFVGSEPDEALAVYLEQAIRRRASRGKTLLQRLTRLVMSDFDANALLGMYPMHLLSTVQAEQLLGRDRGGRLLDIGAGSGDVTAALEPLFEATEVVEVSRWARKRLTDRGYCCHDCDITDTGLPARDYTAIALLNVLDRADRPLTLLEKCRSAMRSETRLLVSMPLPYRPLVYAGLGGVREPAERLPVVGNVFESALLRFVQSVLEPNGLVVERFTRVPYLSGGDSHRALTVLDAAVFVCTRTFSVAAVERER